MILIIGASGRLGQAIARGALEAGKPVRAASRTPEEKLAGLKAEGAEVIAADLRDPASLQRACQGVEVVVASAHGAMEGWGNHSKLVDDKGHRDLIDAAKAAGVKHFIYISALGVDPQHRPAGSVSKLAWRITWRRADWTTPSSAPAPSWKPMPIFSSVSRCLKKAK